LVRKVVFLIKKRAQLGLFFFKLNFEMEPIEKCRIFTQDQNKS